MSRQYCGYFTVDEPKLIAVQACSSDVTVKFYEGLSHEILNEPEREAILEDIVAWVDARI